MKIPLRVPAALALLLASLIIRGPAWLPGALAVTAYALSGYDVLWRALRNITRGRVFDENFLMSRATVGAIII
ncbi:MAG: heavy metal translocating P-type ATPase, partial [Eubacteriales bacterium]|nr:heavy metal translocating P-type ATPase [Eubacteriales bacterium]